MRQAWLSPTRTTLSAALSAASKSVAVPKSVPAPAKVGIWTGLGDHVLLTIGAVIAAAIVASCLLRNLKNGD